jgi:branched-chain amino acid transport system substrate-binding protein
MIRPIPLTLLLALAAVTTAACGGDSESASGGSKTVKIGVLLSETGPAAAQGEVHRRGVELILDRVNADGGVNGKKVEAVFADDESSPDRAVELARDLASDDVVAIVGPSIAATCGPVQPLIEREGVFTYCLSGAPFEWTPNFFAAAPPPVDALATTPLTWAASKGYDDVACLATTDVSGDAYVTLLEAGVETTGQTMTFERYATGDPSVQTQLTKVRAADADLVYSCASGANLVTVAKGMVALDMDQPLLSGLGSVGQPVAQAIKETLPSGGIFAFASWIDVPESMPADLANRDAIQQYADDYQETYGERADRASADAADGLSLILEALESGADTGSEISKYVASMDSFEGIAGTYSSFADDNHRGLDPTKLLVRFSDTGAFEYVETLP